MTDRGDQEQRWTAVTPSPRPSRLRSNWDATDPTHMSKSSRKNLRRKERRRFERKWGVRPEDAEAMEAGGGQVGDRSVSAAPLCQGQGQGQGQGPADVPGGGTSAAAAYNSSHDDEAVRRAIAASIADAGPGPDEGGDPRRKRLRNLRKKIAAAEALALAPQSTLDGAQLAKLERLPALRSEADGLCADLDSEEAERIRSQAALRARGAEAQRRAIAEWSDLEDGRAVEGFRAGADKDEFACPLCAGPLEAATACLPCRHVFCRACLEEAAESAAERSGGDPRSLVCPLCRAELFDPPPRGGDEGRILVCPAMNVRKRMRKRKCQCRCGAEVALSSLRAHLRDCSEAAPGLFGDDQRKRFGHEFAMPRLDPDKVDDMAGRPRRSKHGRGRGEQPLRSTNWAAMSGLVPADYDEDAALQAALALSSIET